MLFNSYSFIFAFLPIVVFLFYWLAKNFGKKIAVRWVVISSLFFYGYWNPSFLWFMGASLTCNYIIGKIIYSNQGNKLFLYIGVLINLGFLGYFKYANFVVNAFNDFSEASFTLAPIALPLAISFFTFEQIAYIVDTSRGEGRDYSVFEYCMFITFFPQLIAGPIAHHSEILPQIEKKENFVAKYEYFSIGLTIFFIGLCKKTFLADSLAEYATPVFERAKYGGSNFGLLESWGASISYTLQLYFDFSGYSDMAIGLAWLFGIKLPLNFNSPYKAVSIIDLWRRWHMTLSRFLRDYIYIPLGGNKKGILRKYINIWITMFLGGVWHGAGWTFVIWGALHSFMLIINHIWKDFIKIKPPKTLSIFITFIVFNISMVIFRAENMDAVKVMYNAMLGKNGLILPTQYERFLAKSDFVRFLDSPYNQGLEELFFILLGLFIVWFMPNTTQIMNKNCPALYVYDDNKSKSSLLNWSPSLKYAFLTGLLVIISFLSMAGISEFLYFQF